MNKEDIVYLKTKNSNILKCLKSEQMNKPIFYPIESKTNGYVDWNDVKKIFTIDDFYKENINLKQALNEIKKYIIVRGLNDNRNFMDGGVGSEFQNILQIIDKVLGDSYED